MREQGSRTVRIVFLLLEAQCRLIWNGLRRGTGRTVLAWAVGGIGLGLASSFLGLWGYSLGKLLRIARGAELVLFVQAGLDPQLLAPERLLVPLVFLLVSAVWGMILLSGLGTAIQTFFLNSDLELLMAAPIPARAVFAAKFLESLGVAYLLLFALGAPALLGMGAGAHFPGAYYLGCVLLFVLLPLLPQSVGMLLVLPLVRLIPPRRLREALSLLGAALGAAFYLLAQAPASERLDPGRLAQALKILQRGYLPFLPQAWAAEGLRALAEGAYGRAAGLFAALTVLTGGVYVGCLLLAERLYFAGWANLQAAPEANRGARRRRARTFRDTRWLPRPILAIVAKDLRVFVRNPNYWSQMLMPLAGFVVVIVQSLQARPDGSTIATWISPLFQMGMILFLALAAVARFGLAGVGSESLQLWLLRAAPVSMAQVLWAKWVSAYLLYTGLTSLMVPAYALISHLDWRTALAGWLFLVLAGAGTNAIGVGLGGSFVRLERERTGRPYSPGVALLYFPLTGGFAALLGLLIAIGLGGEVLQTVGRPMLAWAARAFGCFAAVALAAVGVHLPLRIGARRLARSE